MKTQHASRGIALTVSLSSALNGSGWSMQRPGRFTAEKDTHFRKMGGFQGQAERVRKFSLLPGFYPQTVRARSWSLF